jgi:hypothetical protein
LNADQTIYLSSLLITLILLNNIQSVHFNNLNKPIMRRKSKKTIGLICSTLVILFLLFDSIAKIAGMDEAVNATIELGYPEGTVAIIGALLLLFTILYAIPGTSFLGAVLLTAYLGGAVATNLRVEAPLFTHILFPVYIGMFVWVGQVFRQEKLLRLLFNK